MRKGLLFIAVMVFFSLQSAAYAQQDVKQKPVVVTDTTATIISLIDSNRLSVKNAPIGKKLIIYSIIGNKVKEFDIKISSAEYTLNLPKSVYIIKIGETITQKCVIK